MTPIQEAMLRAGLISKSDVEIVISSQSEQKSFQEIPFEEPIDEKISEEKVESKNKKNKKKEYFQCLACGRPSEDELYCIHCGGDVVEINSVPKVKGHMVWTHKTAPTFQFDDNPTMTPDDYARGRRR
jgi:hypothetical protein